MKKHAEQGFITPIMWIGPLLLAGLYLTSLFNYALFHILAEILAVVIASAIVMVAWTARTFSENTFLSVIGSAYLSASVFIVFHLLSENGINVLPGADINLSTQLGLASRLVLSLSFLAAPFFIGRSSGSALILSTFIAVSLILFAAILVWPILPAAYLPGTGLTRFKITCEYCFAAIFALALGNLIARRKLLDRQVFRSLVLSLALSILAEVFFTLNPQAGDYRNLGGHLLNVAGMTLVYSAIVNTGLTQPYTLLFHNLQQSGVALKKERDFVTAIMDTADVLVVVANSRGRILRCNRACEDITGYRSEELRGASLWKMGILPGNPEQVRHAFETQSPERLPRHCEGELITKDRRHLQFAWSNAILLDPDQMAEFVITTGIDITARQISEENLRYLSNHDTLTGLYNRTYFETELNRLSRGRQFPVSVIMLDVDGLKKVNDTHGHPVGDELLIQVAYAMRAAFRAEDVIARIGGDEFCVLLPGANYDTAENAIRRVQEHIAMYNAINKDMPISISMGAATAFDVDGLNSSLIRADQNMYTIKNTKPITREHPPE